MLSGARGGHSGGDIASGRVNAIKALGRVLARSFEQEPFRLARFDGGVSRNAIPRDARAVVVLEPDAEPAFRAAAEQELAGLVRAVRRDPTTGSPSRSTASTRSLPWASAPRLALLDLVTAIPTGVIAMSPELPGVVETSTSLTVATTDDEVLTLASMTRSSNAPALEDVAATIAAARASRRSDDRGRSLLSALASGSGLAAARNRQGDATHASSGPTRRWRSSTAGSSAPSSGRSSLASR